MAADTAQRRMSLGWGLLDTIGPLPDGADDAEDRLVIAWLYGGIAAPAPTTHVGILSVPLNELRELLARAKASDGAITKSGLMVGLGERWDELLEVMRDLTGVRCDVLTIGQYLRPSSGHLPVARYYEPREFRALAEEGRRLGFRHVEAGPLVRSSYHAEMKIQKGADLVQRHTWR